MGTLEPGGKCYGALIEALTPLLGDLQVYLSESWRNLILKASEAVNASFPQQHPQAEGPQNRAPFQLDEVKAPAFSVRMEGNLVVLAAGRVQGVRLYNKDNFFPSDYATTKTGANIAEATAIEVQAFKSRLEVRFTNSDSPGLLQGAQAILRSEAPKQWPVEIPDELTQLRSRAAQSTNICASTPGEVALDRIAHFRQEDNRVVLRTAQGIQIASQPGSGACLSGETVTQRMQAAEQLSEGHAFLSLADPKRPEEVLRSDLEVELGLVDSQGRGEPLEQTEPLSLVEHQRIYIRLHNRGQERIFVNILNIDVTGTIELLAFGFPNGIKLARGEVYTLSEGSFGGTYDGLALSWPSDVPRHRFVGETVFLILTDIGVDLRHRIYPRSSRDCKVIMDGRGYLDQYVHRIRDVSGDARRRTAHYATRQIEFNLCPEAARPDSTAPSGTRGPGDCSPGSMGTSDSTPYIPADQLPILETSQAYKDLLSSWSTTLDSPRSLFGAAWRTVRRVPPHVKIINEHVEPITVVVSKDRPRRFLSGLGFNIATDGLGLTFETADPGKQSPAPVVFPLWTRKEDYGVISIFTGPDQKLFIENDRAPIGATLIFRNKPDMMVVLPAA